VEGEPAGAHLGTGRHLRGLNHPIDPYGSPLR
jgi:hypothetical protein